MHAAEADDCRFAADRSLDTEAVDPERLAVLLAERLNAVAPPGFRVEAAGGMLWYHAASPQWDGGTSGTYIRENFPDQLPLAERIRAVSEQALDEFQDFVDENSAEPWPGVRTVPRAHAEVRGSWVYLWYGPADAPALECEPIEIA